MPDNLTAILGTPSQMTPIPGISAGNPALAAALQGVTVPAAASTSGAVPASQLEVAPQDKAAAENAVGALSAEGQKLSADEQKAFTEFKEKLTKNADEYISAQGGFKLPELNLPKPPAPVSTDPWAVWGSPAMMFGLLGGLFTRQHAINALNTAAGVMSSYNAKDKEANDKAMDAWKESNANLIKSADFAEKTLGDALRINEDVFNARARALGDVFAENLKTDEDRQKYVDDIAKYKVQLLTFTAKQQAAQDKGILSDTEFEKLKALPEVIQGVKDHEAGLPWSQAIPGYGINNPVRLAAERLYGQKHPGETSDFAAEQAGFWGQRAEAATEGRQVGGINLAANSLDESLPLLKQAADRVDNSRWTDWNSFENFFKDHSTDPDLINLRQAILTTESDLALVIGKGRNTVDAQQTARTILNDTMGKGGVYAFADFANKEKERQLLASSKTTGRNEGQLPNFNSPDDPGYKALQPGDSYFDDEGNQRWKR